MGGVVNFLGRSEVVVAEEGLYRSGRLVFYFLSNNNDQQQYSTGLRKIKKQETDLKYLPSNSLAIHHSLLHFQEKCSYKRAMNTNIIVNTAKKNNVKNNKNG